MAGILRAVLATLLLPLPLIGLLRWLRLRGRAAVEVSVAAALSRGRDAERLARALDELREDRQVRGVRLRLDGARGTWADLQSLHVAIRRLVEAGKPVVAAATSLGDAELYLASAASRVLLLPAGDVQAAGPAGRLVFIGDALARLGVLVEVVSAGAYKSAGEALVRSVPSPEHREAAQALLDGWRADLVQAVARGRRLAPEVVERALAATPLSSDEALSLGIVDALSHEDQVGEALEEALGFEPIRVSFGAWARLWWLRGLARRLAGVGAPVAVVRLRGAVVDRAPEAGGRDVIAADRVVPLLDALGEDGNVRGVLLCVDSSGGGALASERIARAVQRLQEEKPVVALLQGVAASGGYYIAAPAGAIFAQPGTVTGSIGVVGARLCVLPALGRHGVHVTAIGTGPGSDLPLGLRGLAGPERRRLEALVDRTYAVFLDRVAAGRRMPRRAVEPLAEGRVWSGRVAHERGLVDHLGAFPDALDHLYRLVGLPRVPGLRPRLDLGLSETVALPRLVRGFLGRALTAALPGLATLARFAAAAEPPPALDALLESPGRTAVLAIAEWGVEP